MASIHYDTEQLALLEATIQKCSQNIVPDRQISLQTTSFNQWAPWFSWKYRDKTPASVQHTHVTMDIPEVLDILKKQTFLYAHATCAANAGPVNAALCIHYRERTTGQIWSVALPGVYIKYDFKKE